MLEHQQIPNVFPGSDPNQEPPYFPQKTNLSKAIHLTILGGIVLVGFILLYTYYTLAAPVSSQENKQLFVVKPGEASKVIAEKLEQEGLIRSSSVFNLYGYITGDGRKIKAGEYILSQNMDTRQILHALVVGGQDSQGVVRIQEGWSLSTTAEYLEEKGIADDGEFEKAVAVAVKDFSYFGETPKVRSLEGYLFPDTYFVTNDGTESKQVISLALENMESKLDQELRAEISRQGKTIYEILTLASIIEREVGRNLKVVSADDRKLLEDERKMVASVFYNRLEIGMPLQSDATVTYITKRPDPSATLEETKIDSPYNTYKYPGLPPGPIASPSTSSIRAAVYPSSTNYIYFLSKPDGTAVFSRTLDEHNANKAKYLR
jgi:UPF0755 protein